LLSAIFAAVTAIFAKIGIANINVIRAAILALTRQYEPLARFRLAPMFFLPYPASPRGLPGFAIFALQLGGASRVAPANKLTIVLVAGFGAAFLGERFTAAN
jgi:transporter family protein